MMSALSSPKFPLHSTHSSYPRAPDPLFASLLLSHAVQVAVPFHGGSADARGKKIEKELIGTELFHYVVKCSLPKLLDVDFVCKHVLDAGNGRFPRQIGARVLDSPS